MKQIIILSFLLDLLITSGLREELGGGEIACYVVLVVIEKELLRTDGLGGWSFS
jgi:hypothetical protein